MESILASICLAISIDFWSQVGKQNLTNINQKRYRQKSLKKEGQQDGQQDAPRAYGDDSPHPPRPGRGPSLCKVL